MKVDIEYESPSVGFECRAEVLFKHFFIQELRAFIRSQPHGITEFDQTLVKHLLERVTVFGDYLVFRFRSWVEIVVER